jgi:tetratricopeptide (TPR) repeat protein
MKSFLIFGTCAAIAAAVASGCSTSSQHLATEQQPKLFDACAIALAAFEVRDETDRAIASLQQAVRRGGEAERSLEQLGYRYVARARERSDEGDYLLAERTAECLLARQPDHASAQLLRGHALHQMHRFEEAEAIARRLVRQRQFVLDYGLLGDVLMERGRLSDAAAAYQKMIDLKPFYQSYTRAAHVRWLRGDRDGAVELLGMALDSASARDPDSIAWAYSRLAIYEAQAGRLSQAGQAADTALRYKRDYPAALLAKGGLLLAMNRAKEAVPALRRAADLTARPDAQWALADALRLVDRDGDADLVEQKLTRDGEATDRRTLALFLATRRMSPSRAVDLARRELGVRQDVFTLDALAWALAAAGHISEAESSIARALAEGTQDGRLFLHAAAIAQAAGRRADAVRWLTRAERLGATLLPSELDELRNIRNGLFARQENSK